MQIEKPLPEQPAQVPEETPAQETPFETISGYCSMFVVILFIFTFLGQNFVIPSGSMEKTLLIGDHLFVDRVMLAPGATWMPLVRYREPRRGDIVVFRKPAADPDPLTGAPTYPILVKRLIGIPGDRIHLHDGVVYLNGVPQNEPHAQPTTPENHMDFVDEFPLVQPISEPGNMIPEAWAVDFFNHLENGDLVVPPGNYFMMGDNRHNSADSRYWGFVPRENIIGRPLFNYWSFQSSEDQLESSGLKHQLKWMGHVAVHFFSDTRWSRSFHVVK
jgi:signal peptidase I